MKTLASREVYLEHYIEQSCGRVKIAEYACPTLADAERIQREIAERNPLDQITFYVRMPAK